MVIAVYLLIIFSAVTQSAATKLFHRYCPHSAVFNAIKSLSALVFFALIAAFGFSFHAPTLLFGLLYGGALCFSMYAGYKALCLGPMALTSMLISFSVMLPLLWGITVGNERVSTLQCVALACLPIAIVLTNLRRPSAADTPSGSARWLVFVGITFLCNGVCSILQKQHQTLYPQAQTREFMLYAMLLAAAVFSAAALRKLSPRRLWEARGKAFGVLSGVANGLANLLTLLLASMENASVLFPIISLGTILASLLCGKLFFRERLRVNHYLALAVGGAAVVLLKL